MSEMRTIRVTGKGSMKVRPDATRLLITIEGVEMEYRLAVEQSTKQTEELREKIAGLGFDKRDLKTVSFDISVRTEGYRDENGDYQARFAGYAFTHELKLEFPSDNELLGRLLYMLSQTAAQPEFGIVYFVSDPEAAKNELLSRAVKDARTKAEVLAAASEVKLGEILSIDYSWGELRFEYQAVENNTLASDGALADMSPAYRVDMEPDEIGANDTVTIVWAIR